MSLIITNESYINGEWIPSFSGEKLEVKNPANGKLIGTVPNMGIKETEKAISSAYEAFQTWQNTTARERSVLLKKWFQLLEVNKEKIGQILTSEVGKPIREGIGEVMFGNEFVEWFAEEGTRLNGEIIQSPSSNKRIVVEKQPIGVAAIITPWNYPYAMITRKVAPALAAGCTCVIKPAEDTPFSTLAAVKLAEVAGIPKGVINVVTCDRKNAADVGTLLCQSPLIAGVYFTGSTRTGKILYQQCASGIKRIGLELGGNAPFIVYNTAKIDNAVRSAMTIKFANCGQACISANRFLVHEVVYDEFVAKITAAIKTLKMGDPSSVDTQIGPLINKAQFTKVSNIVQDAISKGAQVLLGGKPASHIGELYFEPTVLVDINNTMDIYNEEIFGPVVSIIKFKSEEESLKIANNVRSGLAGYMFSEDVSQIYRVSKKLEQGMVGVNESHITCVEAPFGGIKESGIGRDGSKHGLDDFIYCKTICIGNLTP